MLAIGLGVALGLSGCGGGDRGIDEEIDFGEAEPFGSPNDFGVLEMPDRVVDETPLGPPAEVAPPVDSPDAPRAAPSGPGAP